MESFPYQAAADAVLFLHAGTVLFIVGGLLLIFVGGARRWRWVRNFRFRVLHVAAIVFVAVSTWIGIECPLTTLEVWLRLRAGQAAYEGDFIAHWLGAILFYQAPPWVFVSVYTAFALVVLFSWIRVRPRH